MEPPYVNVGSESDAEAYLQSSGHWTVANLMQSIGWIQKPITIEFSGQTLVLLPEDENSLPAIAAVGDGDETRRLIMEFVSALTWSALGEISIRSWGGGGRPYRMSKRQIGGQVVAAKFQVNYLPTPTDRNAKLALAFFHEGSGLARSHVAYSFLSFYKIINLVGGMHGQSQIDWINGHLGMMTHHRAAERLKALQAQNVDIGQYIYQSCRCAIAHAGDPRNPVVDPHNLEDQKRLHADLPLIITLAEIAIEQELSVKTSQTVYREHRYELSGFESLFEPDLVEQLKAGVEETETGEINISHLNIKMQDKKPYSILTNLTPTAAQLSKGVVSIFCLSPSRRYLAVVVLNFPSYRLSVEVGPAEGFVDDGSVEFINEVIEIERFFWDFNCNGCLEVWSDEGRCLGRCDAFIPTNVIMNSEGYNARLAELTAEAGRRA